MKSIAIMQPTFLPWIGYFALIDRVDEFVLFDHVQFEKRSWQQRNKIKTPSGPQWLSVPVMTKGKQDQSICETQILYEGNKNPLDKIMKSIEMNYAKAAHYRQYAPQLEFFFHEKPLHISKLNESIIKWICSILNINTPFINSSALNAAGTKDELLLDICKKRNCTHYFSPPGSKSYLEGSDIFEKAGIPILYHNYKHPQYSQLHGDFEPYMCILDLLFNEGARSAEIIRKGLDKQ